jgi:hypothetical protein
MSPGPLHPVGFWAAGGGGTVPVISGGSSSHFVSGGAVNAGVTFNVDGECYDLGSALGGRTIFTSGEWWPDEPDTGIGSSYDIRQASLTTGAWNVQAATVTTWVQISVERIWRCNVTAMSAPNVSSASGVFEVRGTGSGSAIDSATYSAEASN